MVLYFTSEDCWSLSRSRCQVARAAAKTPVTKLNLSKLHLPGVDKPQPQASSTRHQQDALHTVLSVSHSESAEQSAPARHPRALHISCDVFDSSTLTFDTTTITTATAPMLPISMPTSNPSNIDARLQSPLRQHRNLRLHTSPKFRRNPDMESLPSTPQDAPAHLAHRIHHLRGG